MKIRNVAVLIFDEVEVLDFAGPFEVFSVTRMPDDEIPFNVYTVAQGRHHPQLSRNFPFQIFWNRSKRRNVAYCNSMRPPCLARRNFPHLFDCRP